jgi:hypothetical protein
MTPRGERKAPIAIAQNGEVTGVVCDVDVYQKQQRDLAMLKLIAQSESDVREGRTRSHDRAIAAL